jgi:hypothetical protein
MAKGQPCALPYSRLHRKEFLATDFQSMLFPEDLGDTLVMIHDLISGKTANCQMEQRYLHKTGKTVWGSWSVSNRRRFEVEPNPT